MKKHAFVLVTFIFLFLSLSCQTERYEIIEKNIASQEIETNDLVNNLKTIEVRILSKSDNFIPNWLYSTWKIDNIVSNEKYIIIIAEGHSGTLDIAKSKAEKDLYVKLDEAINNLLIPNIYSIIEENSSLDKYFRSVEFPTIKIADIQNLTIEEEYWEYLQESDGVNYRTYYRYFIKYSLDYFEFINLIENIYLETTKKAPLTLRNNIKKVWKQLYNLLLSIET